MRTVNVKDTEEQAFREELKALLDKYPDFASYVRVENASDARGGKSIQGINMPQSVILRHAVKEEGKKKSILVVEDSEINREILQELLQDEFQIYCAENGEEGIRILKKHREELSLILLDVYMPVCNGFEFLEKTQKDPYLSSVPVIVATGSDKHEDEEQCLRLGATDFITKPYNTETMLGRIHNVINLRETLSTLSIVEFDSLTGLYTMSAFSHHTQQILMEQDGPHDLAIIDIQDFSSVNGIYGERKGDEILKQIAEDLRLFFPHELIARQGDCFFILGTEENRKRLREIMNHYAREDAIAQVSGIRIRMGIYEDIDIKQPVSILCDRVKIAVKSIDGSQGDAIAYYDTKMEERRLSDQKMIMAFDKAIKNREFIVWLQPKVDISTGKIVGAEALVRWIDETGKFISPGAFIPLFEREGLIRQLDEFIFRSVCAFQRKQAESGRRVIPISVNLSRYSLFSKGIVSLYGKIADEEAVNRALVPIEITESAATSENQIVQICEEFVKAGFCLHMDDFGTGYSSLSALTALPFSVLKLDKTLIDTIGSERGNIVIKNIVQTAQDLGMHIVAEGVEEKDQVEFLALIGCDYIQGYYYAPPGNFTVFNELLASDDPFAGKEKIKNLQTEGIIRITSSELKHYLQVCRILFSSVRVLDQDCKRYRIANADGSLSEYKEPCFGFWDKKGSCENCISRKVMKTRHTDHKFEVLDDRIFIVYSLYIEVDGEPHAVELVNGVGEQMMHGFHKSMTFLQALQNEHREWYEEKWLGIYNRRFFEEQIDILSGITAVAMIDIDNFKAVNETHGREVGDRLLKAVVDAIKKCIRKNDYLIRMGGDEFLLAFIGMKEEMFEEKLEEVRLSVENLCVPECEEVHATITMGGSFCRGFSEQILKTIDKALTEGKKRYNTVVVNNEYSG